MICKSEYSLLNVPLAPSVSPTCHVAVLPSGMATYPFLFLPALREANRCLGGTECLTQVRCIIAAYYVKLIRYSA